MPTIWEEHLSSYPGTPARRVRREMTRDFRAARRQQARDSRTGRFTSEDGHRCGARRRRRIYWSIAALDVAGMQGPPVVHEIALGCAALVGLLVGIVVVLVLTSKDLATSVGRKPEASEPAPAPPPAPVRRLYPQSEILAMEREADRMARLQDGRWYQPFPTPDGTAAYQVVPGRRYPIESPDRIVSASKRMCRPFDRRWFRGAGEEHEILHRGVPQPDGSFVFDFADHVCSEDGLCRECARIEERW
jgi:hypothetical protein